MCVRDREREREREKERRRKKREREKTTRENVSTQFDLESNSQCSILQLRSDPTRAKHLSGASLYVNPLDLPTNTLLGCKGLPGTNTLAFYKDS